MSTEPKYPILTCSENVVTRLLNCTKPEIFEKEKAGLLTHIRLPFFRDYWEHYDVRHYGLDEVLALLPESSGMAERFKLLKRAHKDIMAGQIALGAVYAHFLVKISKAGSVIKTRTAVKRSRRA